MTLTPTVLNAIIWLPALGAIVIALIGRGLDAPRVIALTVSGVVLLLSLLLYVAYWLQLGTLGAAASPDDLLRFQTSVPFIPAINSSYWVGVDGISLPLIVLNALLSFLAVVISWNVTLRPQL